MSQFGAGILHLFEKREASAGMIGFQLFSAKATKYMPSTIHTFANLVNIPVARENDLHCTEKVRGKTA